MKIYLIILLLFVSPTIFSQSTTEQIFRNLHNGAILVRLSTKSNTINAVKKKDSLLAKRIQKEQANRNKDIINAFTNNFTLCPVYYFYSEDSKKIRDKEFAGVLYDANMNLLTQIPKLDANYLIATFSYTKVDTTTYYTVSYLSTNPDTRMIEWKEQRGNSSIEGGVDALVLFSPELIALQKPYPHYVRTFERLLFLERSRAQTVEIMQYKIMKYLSELPY